MLELLQKRVLLRMITFMCLLASSLTMAQEKPDTRSFLLGFTYQPYDWSERAFEDTYSFINQNSDMVFYYFDDGVPWQEAATNSPYHNNVETLLNKRLAHVADNQKVAVGVNFLAKDRLSLAAYWGEEDALPRSGRWANRDVNDPNVIKAYVSYCKNMIRRFKPDYFVYGMEIDSVEMDVSSKEFIALEEMTSIVYTELRQEFKDLPLVLTFMLAPEKDMQIRKKMVKKLLPYTDIYAVSLYPYLFDGIGGDADKLPTGLLSKVKSYIGNKPFAVAETGFNAKTWRVLSRAVWVPGNEQSQAKYVDFLLREASKMDALFVNWWVPRDLDALWIKMKNAGADPMFSQWNSNGLLTSKGEHRQGLKIWRQWLDKPWTLTRTASNKLDEDNPPKAIKEKILE